MNPFSFFRYWLHNRRSEAELRTGYRGNLSQSASTLEDRIHFHLEHLWIYWRRWRRIAHVTPGMAVGENALRFCVRIANQESTADFAQFCAARGAESVRSAWQDYLKLFGQAPDPAVSPEAHLRACTCAFRLVRKRANRVLRSRPHGKPPA